MFKLLLLTMALGGVRFAALLWVVTRLPMLGASARAVVHAMAPAVATAAALVRTSRVGRSG